jgi:hypothetical protein
MPGTWNGAPAGSAPPLADARFTMSALQMAMEKQDMP